MSDNLSKQVFNSLFPPGSIWIPIIDKDLDLLINGMATNSEEMRIVIDSLAFIRDPQKTPIIKDLEKEFGLTEDPSLTDQERRNRVLSAKTANKGDGTDDFMQTKLQESGFDLQVHQNEPPVDPSTILDDGFFVYCDGDDAFCGNENALCGQQSGQLIVNGIAPFDSIFVSPVSSDYWHLVFFIGGDVTRNAVTNEIEAIVSAQIPISRSSELIRLIVKYKPMHSWCGLMVDFI